MALNHRVQLQTCSDRARADAEVSLCITKGCAREKVLPTKQLNDQTSLDLVFKRQAVQKVGRAAPALSVPGQNGGRATNSSSCPATGYSKSKLAGRLLEDFWGKMRSITVQDSNCAPSQEQRFPGVCSEAFVRGLPELQGAALCCSGTARSWQQSDVTQARSTHARYLVFVDGVTFLLMLQS